MSMTLQEGLVSGKVVMAPRKLERTIDHLEEYAL